MMSDTSSKKHKKSHKKKLKSSSSSSSSPSTSSSSKHRHHHKSSTTSTAQAPTNTPPVEPFSSSGIVPVEAKVTLISNVNSASPTSVNEEALLQQLVQDEEQRETIKNTLRRFEIIRRKLMDGKAGKAPAGQLNGSGKRKTVSRFRLYKRGPTIDRLDADEVETVPLCVRSASADALFTGLSSTSSFPRDIFPFRSQKPSPYDTGLSTTARPLPDIPIPLVDVRLPAALALDWEDLPNLSALRTHFSREGRLEVEVASLIVERTKALLQKEPNCLSLTAPCNIFGDIHGQFFDLLEIFKNLPAGSEENSNNEDPQQRRQNNAEDFPQCLFLGDYVDRGCFSTEVILYLFSLKLRHPSRIHLLRGNHETRGMTKSFNFKRECLRKYNKSFYRLVCRAFDFLPLAATLKTEMGTFFCVHGGISPELEKLSDLEELNRSSEPTEGLFSDLLWADPLPLPSGMEDVYEYTAMATSLSFEPNVTRGCSVHFGLQAVKSFLNDNSLVGIIRGHEMQREGYYEHFFGYELLDQHSPSQHQERYPPLMTVFSAPNYCDADNKGAIIQMDWNSWRPIQIEANMTAPYCLPTLSDAINFSVPYMCDCIAKAYTYMLAQIIYVLCTDEETGTVDCAMYQKMVALLKNSAERKIQRELQQLDDSLHHPFLPKSRRPSSLLANKSKVGLFLSASTQF